MTRSPVCIDASVVVSLVTPEQRSRSALALWERWMHDDTEVIAPVLLRYEVTSALWRKALRGTLCLADARRALQAALSLDIRPLDPPDLPVRAFDLAARLNSPAAYDAHYLALAEMVGCPFCTADERLYNTVRGSLPGLALQLVQPGDGLQG